MTTEKFGGQKYEFLPLATDDKELLRREEESNAEPTGRTFLYLAASIANLASFTCGFAFGWSSPEIPKFKAHDSPLPRGLTLDQESWIGSLLPIGAGVGPLLAGILADKIGRKLTIIVGTIPLVIAFILAAIANEVYFLYLMRFLSGLGIGFTFTVLPMYIGEISDDEVRGQLGSFMLLFISFGLTLAFCGGPYLSITLFNLLLLIIPVLFIFLFWIFVPESPYYLLKIGKKSEAEKALMKFRSQSSKGVQRELSLVNKSIEETTGSNAGLGDLFATKALRKAVFISIALVFFQQASGINVVVFYAQDIFEAAGSTLPPEIAVILLGVVQILGCGLTPVLVNKYGKKALLLLSAVGMTLFLAVLAYFFYLKESGQDVSTLSWLPITSIIMYIIIYCLGIGPLPWAIMAELFPGNVKSLASTITASSCWILAFIITKYFTIVVNSWGQNGLYGLFSLVCIAGANFIYIYLPETSGKSVDEILQILGQ